jgi:hypothetical protein
VLLDTLLLLLMLLEVLGCEGGATCGAATDVPPDRPRDMQRRLRDAGAVAAAVVVGGARHPRQDVAGRHPALLLLCGLLLRRLLGVVGSSIVVRVLVRRIGLCGCRGVGGQPLTPVGGFTSTTTPSCPPSSRSRDLGQRVMLRQLPSSPRMARLPSTTRSAGCLGVHDQVCGMQGRGRGRPFWAHLDLGTIMCLIHSVPVILCFTGISCGGCYPHTSSIHAQLNSCYQCRDL